MKTWKATRAHIKAIPPPARPADKEAFWQDFRRQAGPQDNPPAKYAPHAPFWLAPAAACALLLLVLGAALLLRPGATETAGTGSTVESIQVLACHESVFILQDPHGKGTIIWIDLCPVENETGKG